MDQKNNNNSRRIHSYDFFQGVLVTGLIFLMTFSQFTLFREDLSILYRWASLGFLFFSGIIEGETMHQKKNILFFKRGLHIFGIFIGLNFLLFFSHQTFSQWGDFSAHLIQGDERFIASLLLPLSAFFLFIPLFRLIPPLLGVFWGTIGFILMDLISIEKDIFFLNALFLLTVLLGYYIGRLFSFESLRIAISNRTPFLPFLFLYLGIGILVLGSILNSPLLSVISVFWTFHLLVSILFYFSLPSLLFVKGSNKPFLRKFFEILGVESFFVYIFSSFVIFLIGNIFLNEKFLQSQSFNVVILSVHFVIFFFGVVLLIQKKLKKSSKMRKRFRFIF